MKTILFLILIIICSFVDAQSKIEIKDAWVRPAAKHANSALYFTINNNGEVPDILVSAKSKSADLTEVHDSLHFGCWDKFFELRIINAKKPNTPDMLSMSDVRIVQSHPGTLIYTTSTDIPCDLFYKILIFLPPEIEKFSEYIVLSCNLSDYAFKPCGELKFPIVAAKKHNALQKDTLICRLDRDMANKICAQIKH